MGHFRIRRMHKKGKYYYHESRVPVDLHEMLGKEWINISLKVEKLDAAEIINSRIFIGLNDLYCDLRAHPHTPIDAQTKLAKLIKRKPPVPPSTENSVQLTPMPISQPAKGKHKQRRLSDLVDQYSKEKKINWGDRSNREIPGRLDTLLESLKNPVLTDIDREQLIEWRDIFADNREGQTLKQYLDLLSGMFKLAMAYGWMTNNPAYKLPYEKDRRPKHEIRAVFESDELSKIFAFLQANKEKFYAAGHHERYWVMLLMAYSGARVRPAPMCEFKTWRMPFSPT